MRRINIALDGYAGCGKSTTAKGVAARLGYIFIDTGSMYRAFTLYCIRHSISYQDLPAVIAGLAQTEITFRLSDDGLRRTLLNGEDVSEAIRSMEVSALVSEVAAIKEVRVKMVEQQRRMGEDRGVVMDGRDIGTVVFPDAELKVFMTASLDARVSRRREELERLGQPANEEDLKRNLLHRDEIDTTRAESPLRRAEDARLLDTTHMTIDQQIDLVCRWAQEIIELTPAHR